MRTLGEWRVLIRADRVCHNDIGENPRPSAHP